MLLSFAATLTALINEHLWTMTENKFPFPTLKRASAAEISKRLVLTVTRLLICATEISYKESLQTEKGWKFIFILSLISF